MFFTCTNKLPEIISLFAMQPLVHSLQNYPGYRQAKKLTGLKEIFDMVVVLVKKVINLMMDSIIIGLVIVPVFLAIILTVLLVLVVLFPFILIMVFVGLFYLHKATKELERMNVELENILNGETPVDDNAEFGLNDYATFRMNIDKNFQNQKVMDLAFGESDTYPFLLRILLNPMKPFYFSFSRFNKNIRTFPSII